MRKTVTFIHFIDFPKKKKETGKNFFMELI